MTKMPEKKSKKVKKTKKNQKTPEIPVSEKPYTEKKDKKNDMAAFQRNTVQYLFWLSDDEYEDVSEEKKAIADSDLMSAHKKKAEEKSDKKSKK
jgi:hypothetical protein